MSGNISPEEAWHHFPIFYDQLKYIWHIKSSKYCTNYIPLSTKSVCGEERLPNFISPAQFSDFRVLKILEEPVLSRVGKPRFKAPLLMFWFWFYISLLALLFRYFSGHVKWSRLIICKKQFEPVLYKRFSVRYFLSLLICFCLIKLSYFGMGSVSVLSPFFAYTRSFVTFGHRMHEQVTFQALRSIYVWDAKFLKRVPALHIFVSFFSFKIWSSVRPITLNKEEDAYLWI